MHTDELPFQCYFYQKAFARKNDLKRHMKTHLVENTYKCSLCHRAFYTDINHQMLGGFVQINI